MNINRLTKISSKVRERRRLSFRRGISGQTDATTIGPEEILPGNLVLPFLKWPNKMSGDPMRHNQNLHCQFHQERGHTTEDCRTLWNHLEQLVKERRLKQFLYRPNKQGDHLGSVNQDNTSLRPPLGMINVIFAAPRRTGSRPSWVMSIARTLVEDSSFEPKRARGRGYDVKRVMVDQGGADIMYPDLYKGLNLKLEDLTTYDSPLISIEAKAVMPKGQIRLLVQSYSEVVEVEFIVVVQDLGFML
ncbi:uncharacterized protein LOC142639842 [Castanea sativa]|uniref:uncharacterized protein LOC142639842 n=1 Tax=Castanea sativa TaxID=21020 RepID=UPI003F652D20